MPHLHHVSGYPKTSIPTHDRQYVHIPIGYPGYAPDGQAGYWKFMNGSTEEVITSDTIEGNTIYKAKFKVKDPVTLKTRIANDSTGKGYFANVATPSLHLTTNDQTIENPITGVATKFVPTGNKGYEFSFWSWDEAGTKPVDEDDVGEDGSYAIAKTDVKVVGDP